MFERVLASQSRRIGGTFSPRPRQTRVAGTIVFLQPTRWFRPRSLQSCNLHDTSNMMFLVIRVMNLSVEALEAYQGKHREVLEGTLLERLRLALSNGKRRQSRGSLEQTEFRQFIFRMGIDETSWGMLRFAGATEWFGRESK